MSSVEKAIILVQVESQSGGKRQALMAFGDTRKAATVGGARDNPIRETGKDRGTGSLPMKKLRYWR